MKYANIKNADVGNGPGVRVSIFVSGCTHACPGCFNFEAQDFEFGEEFNDGVIETVIELLKPSYIQGLSILGGEPMNPRNQGGVRRLVERVREVYGDDKDIWTWTGYTYPQSFTAAAKTKHTDFILNNINTLVDGKWDLTKYDIRLKWRGSANQRVINMRETLAKGEVVLIPLDEPIEDILKTIKEKGE